MPAHAAHYQQPVPRMLRYNVEKISFRSNGFNAHGWLFDHERVLSRLDFLVETSSGNMRTATKFRQPRSDVHGDYGVDTALESGFSVKAVSFAVPCRLSLAAVFDDGSETVVPLGHVTRNKTGLAFSTQEGAAVMAFQFDKEPKLFAEFSHLPFVARPSLGAGLQFLRDHPVEYAPLPERVDLLVAAYRIERFFDTFFGSLLRNTTTPFRLIMVDDGNAGDFHYDRMQEVAARVPDSVVLRNDENRGFIYSICRAFEMSRGHFAMVNTDTELPPGWLERLMAPIFANPDRIASTTPFTNAGETVSFPQTSIDNPMYLGLDTERLDRYFSCVDARNLEIELVSGVGFCMGFSRNVVDRIGYFDAPTFGRGYSEENDWSLRARKAGFRNILVPNLFVRHDHGASYLPAEKRQLLKRNLAIVEERYPGYRQSVQDYYDLDPPSRLRSAIALTAACGEARESPVLVVDHSLGGGANHYRQERVTRWLAAGRPVVSALVDGNGNTLDVIGATSDLLTRFPETDPRELPDVAARLGIRHILVNTVVSSPDPLGLLRAIAQTKAATGARVEFAGHDFHPVCPSYTLLDDGGRYCGLPDGDCSQCLARNTAHHMQFSPRGIDLGEWRQAWRDFLGTVCDEIQCFSHASKTLYLRAFPSLEGRIVVRPHSVEHVVRPARLQRSPALHVGVVGAIGAAKGAGFVRDLADLMARREDGSRLTVIGTISASLDPKVATVTGPYARDDVVGAVEASGANVFLVPAIWPETFSYVTEELVQMGVPLAVSNFGALPERIRNYGNGRVLSSLDPETVLSELHSLFHKAAEVR